MVQFLLRHFSGKDKTVQGYRRRVGTLCGCVNACSNLLLFLAKLIIGIFSGSVAVTADAFNNLSDTGSSLVTVFGFQAANRPPDREHPFGHGRIEYIAGVIVSVLILMVGAEFVKSSVDKIIHPEPVEFNWIMLIVLALAVLVKLWMGYANLQFGKEMGGSTTLKAVAVDSLSDVGTTSVAILSLILSQFISFPIDGYLGCIVAVVVLIAGFHILMDTINPLLGQAPSPELVKEIQKRVLSYDGIIGLHDLVIHNYGPVRTIATLHAEVPANRDIIYSHEVIDQAEREIGEALNITVLIHLDPVVIDDEKVNSMRSLVEKCLKDLNPEYDMHDFRMLDGKERINLIFDVVVPYGLSLTDQQVTEQIESRLQQEDPRYHTVITVDKSFIG